jgi:hypothetical protein
MFKINSFLVLLIIIQLQSLLAQNQSTGVMTFSDPNITLKLDKDNVNSIITLTFTGLSDRWFALGFNAELMLANTDCVVMTSDTQLSDMYLPGGHLAPLYDTSNDWILDNNSVTGNLRTIIIHRPFSTGDPKDYIFTTATTTVNLIWAYSSSPTYTLFSHGADNYGGGIANFAYLNTEEFTTKKSLIAYPNPFHNTFKLQSVTNETINKITLFDEYGRIVEEQDLSQSSMENAVFGERVSPGLYFVQCKGYANELLKIIKF